MASKSEISLARAEAAKAAAAATAAKANAEAAKAAASVRAAEIQARQQADSMAADAARRVEARAPAERAYQLGINLAAPVAGVGVGITAAKFAEKRFVSSSSSKAGQLRALATDTRKVIGAYTRSKPGTRANSIAAVKLGAAARTSVGLRLGAPQSRGLLPAAVLLAEAGYARFVLGRQSEGIAKEAVQQVGTGLAFAATTMVGKNMTARAAAKAVPSAVNLATMETAKALAVKAGTYTAPKAVSGATALSIGGKILSRAVPAALVASTAYGAYEGYRQDGFKGAAVGAVDALTFGLGSRLIRSATGYDPVAAGIERAKEAGWARTRAAVARGAATRSGIANRPTARIAAQMAAAASDGMTASYTRASGVEVRSYKTPSRR